MPAYIDQNGQIINPRLLGPQMRLVSPAPMMMGQQGQQGEACFGFCNSLRLAASVSWDIHTLSCLSKSQIMMTLQYGLFWLLGLWTSFTKLLTFLQRNQGPKRKS